MPDTGRHGPPLVAILCIIAAASLCVIFFLPAWIAWGHHEKLKRARASLLRIEIGLRLYETDYGGYPPDLGNMVLAHSRTGVPYLDPVDLIDPWGNLYGYALRPGIRPDVYSLGQDGKPGGTGQDEDIR
jgi:general secretion pathway protein G